MRVIIFNSPCDKVVQALVQAIGVYPPGSLVELTDGCMGVVSSINVHHPTKPVVKLYAPWLCRNDGGTSGQAGNSACCPCEGYSGTGIGLSESTPDGDVCPCDGPHYDGVPTR